MRKKLLLIGCFLCGILAAQVPTAEFANISKAYKKYTNLSMHIEYFVYPNHSSQVPIDHQYGFYKKKGETYCNKLLGFESVVGQKERIVIDSINKKIIVVPSQPFNSADVTMIDFEKSADLFSRVSQLKSRKEEKGYLLEFKEGVNCPFDKIEFYFSEKNSLVTEMVLYYRRPYDFSDAIPKKKGEKPKLKVRFKDINTNPELSADEFEISSYVSGRPGHKKATKKFKEYKVYEQNY